jgi:GTP cyclohydrolase I
MTIASYDSVNGTTSKNGAKPYTSGANVVRPDRATHDGTEAQQYPIPETSHEDMKDAVRTMLSRWAKTQSGKVC